jgi:hypothetical protein
MLASAKPALCRIVADVKGSVAAQCALIGALLLVATVGSMALGEPDLNRALSALADRA